MKRINLLGIILLFSHVVFAQTLPTPSALAVEFLRSPDKAVITDATPEFSWNFPQSGIKQTAYQILVATSPYLLVDEKADCWNSGKITSDELVNISYAGSPLVDNSVYWWQVKVWSETGLESAYSKAQQFITGNFDRSDVDYPGQSKWIELGDNYWVSEDKQSATFQYYNPVSVVASPNNLFVDFGKSAIGILTFTAVSESDQTAVTIHLGERKTADKKVHKNPGVSNIGYTKVEMKLKKGTHHYVVEIPEREISGYLHSQKLAPHYPEVLPYRYVEITGDLSGIQFPEIKQGALFYYFDENASEFECSDDNLKTVWDLCKYTQKATPFLGVYADGNRERMPYEADAYIQQMSHFATDREYSISKFTINFLLDHAAWPTEWQMHMVLMAWEYYMQTGDEVLLNERYEDLKRKSLIALTDKNDLISTRTGKKTIEFLRTLNYPGELWRFRDIVDWPQGGKRGEKAATYQSPIEGGETDQFVFTDYNTVVNAFHYRCLILLGKIADVTGNSQDQAFFKDKADKHYKAFMAAFFNKKKGIFTDGKKTDHSSLHANMFPMAFGMVPKEHINTVAEFIKSRGMACSVYGSQYLLEALYRAGEANHALDLMTSDSKRSWLNMINVGSSMTTEAWDEYYKPNLTWNHAWGSAPSNIVARKLMGIEPIEPTFKTFRIAPQPGRLNEAAIVVPSIRGSIKCDLTKNTEEWKLNLSIPGNSEAELWLPVEYTNVKINGKTASPVRKAELAEASRNVYLLKSGIFKVSASK